MLKTIGFDQLMELFDGWLRDGELAQPELGRYFPHTGRTDQNRISFFGNRFTSACRELFIVRPPPEQRVRVKKQPHFCSQAASSASGKDSKNAPSSPWRSRYTFAHKRLARGSGLFFS